MPPEEDQIVETIEEQPLLPADIATADMDGESPLISPELQAQISGVPIGPTPATEVPVPPQAPPPAAPQGLSAQPDMPAALVAELQAGAQREQQLQDQIIRQTEVQRHVSNGELQEDAERIVEGQYQDAQRMRVAQDQWQWQSDRYNLAVQAAREHGLGMDDLSELLDAPNATELSYRARMKATVNSLQSQVNSYSQRQVRPQPFDSGVTSTPQSGVSDAKWLEDWNRGLIEMNAETTAKANRIIG